MQCTIDNNTVVRLQHCDVQCGAGFMLLKVNALGTYTAARHSHVTAPDRAPSQALTHRQPIFRFSTSLCLRSLIL
jgi:membrane protein YdbS with pleckstrin-like domain